MSVKLKRLDNIDVLCTDVEGIVAFYGGVLGLELRVPYEHGQGWVGYRAGDVVIYFIEEGVGHFGSGWVWLIYNGQLDVISTHDADDMLTRDGVTPLLVCDLWEHAYYLDYKNDRQGFLTAWYDGLANWSFAERQFDAALGIGRGFAYTRSS